MTVDGSVPDPQDDLGVGRVVAPKQIAPGFARGAPNVLTAAPSFSDFAVVLGNSALARPSFANATGNGQDGWKNLSYQDLANVVYQSIAMQPYLGLSDADDPDLTKFRDHGGKMISAHGMADQAIPHNNTVDYYLRSSAITGGMAKTAADYHRLYLIPGMNHCGTFFASPTDPYVPTIEPEGGDKTIYQSGGGGLVPKEFFDAVVEWLEKGTVPPDSFIASNKANTNRRPVCAYPKKITYLGGDINAATSYACK